jgi:hypothetical protein
MEVKQHSNWGHGLHPGQAFDMNCIACQKERAAVKKYTVEYKVGDELRAEEVYAKDELTALFRAGRFSYLSAVEAVEATVVSISSTDA